jgi:hypothetical protein
MGIAHDLLGNDVAFIFSSLEFKINHILSIDVDNQSSMTYDQAEVAPTQKSGNPQRLSD